MIITKKHLSRRTILRGVGASVALPLLDGMVPAYAALRQTAAAPVHRLTALYVPLGMDMARWTPPSEGPLEIMPITRPLEPFKSRMAVLTGLDSREATGNDQGPHPRVQASWLTGARARRTDGIDIAAGISMDQIAAQHFAKETQLSSLELSLEGVDTLNAGCTRYGYSCVYTGTIAWRTATTPLPMEVNPRAVFERMFGTSDTTDKGARAADIRLDRSLLDVVTGQVADLERRIGPSDKRKVDAYLDSVRDVERRIQNAEAQVERELPIVERPAGIPASYADHARMMFDLLVLAFQTDLTRVSTFLYGREASVRGFPEIGVPDSWHPLSHHGYDPEKLGKIAKLNEFHVGLLAYFLGRLQATPDGDGSLLDRTTILYGSGLSDSNLHTPLNLPTLVMGPGIKGGRHVKYQPTPLANLQRTLLEMMGVPVERFGDSTGNVGFLSV
jgi:hypothetical protein